MNETSSDNDQGVDALLQQLADSGVAIEAILDRFARLQPAGGRLARNGRPMPTVTEYLALCRPRLTPVTWASYKPHLERLERRYGGHLIDTILTDDLEALVDQAATDAVARVPNASAKGRGAKENAIGAYRWFFGRGVASDYLVSNPALKIAKPRRTGPRRRALEAEELAEVFRIASTTGNDPRLDALLVRFHAETGARREGAINLTVADIDADNQLIELREKYGKVRVVPATRELVDALLAHAAERGAEHDDDAVFRYRPRPGDLAGLPLSRRRYNTLFERVQAELPWAKRLGVSTHWLRHTAATAMERAGGVAVAAEFLGHEHGHNATFTYIRAVASEVCDAFSVRTGEQHPLATPGIVAGDD